MLPAQRLRPRSSTTTAWWWRSSTTTACSASTSARPWPRGWRGTRQRPTSGWSPATATPATAIAQALPPLDPPARHAARRADRDPLGAGRLRAPLRPAGRGDLAARDGGERRGARGAGRGGRGLHDPRRRTRRPTPVGARHAPAWWEHPDASGRRIALVFFDGPLSHDVAFGLAGTSVQALVDRAEAAGARRRPRGRGDRRRDLRPPPPLHRAGRRLRPRGRGAAAGPRRAAPSPRWLDDHPPTSTATVRESAWSCAHGVGRWRTDCGCSTGGRPGTSPGLAGAAARCPRPAARPRRRGLRATGQRGAPATPGRRARRLRAGAARRGHAARTSSPSTAGRAPITSRP